MPDKPDRKYRRIGLTELARIMRAAQNRIKKQLREFGDSPSLSYTQRIDDIERSYSVIRETWSQYASSEIPEQYRFAGRQVQKQLKDAGFAVRDQLPGMRTATKMVEDSIARMNMGVQQGEDNVKRLFQETQQAWMRDREINQKLAEGLTVSETPDNLQKTLNTELSKRLREEGAVLEINGRKYRSDDYSRLVARTRTREAQSEAARDVITDNGLDLVKISSHNTTTELCQEYEGHVYSLSGKSDRFPKIDQTPPFHPNCQHVMTAYIP